MPSRTHALVLSGGGNAGGAWMLGLIHGLRAHGVDLTRADRIVGTSAGARTGAVIAIDALDHVVELYRRSSVPPLDIPISLQAYGAAVRRILKETPDRRQATRRLANLEPLGPRLASAPDRRAMIAAHLPVDAWPDRDLSVTVADARTGERVVLDRMSPAGLREAVMASCALPGIFPLVTIAGTPYADGGLLSPFNADLAAGCEPVLVLTPVTLGPRLQATLDEEIAALGGVETRVVVPDERARAAIGPDPLVRRTAGSALDSGIAQAAREAAAIAAFWNRA